MVAAHARDDVGRLRLRLTLGGAFLTLAYLALVAPTMVALADQTWSRDFGAYGPIVLVTGLWLLWRQLPDLRQTGSPGSSWITLPLVLIGAGAVVFGRAYDFLTLETAGAYLVGVAMLQSRFGLRSLAPHWFPLLYLAFVIPVPNSVLADLTAPLKQFVSYVSTEWLGAAGIPVARQGVTIFVAQYQLLVEDACSGMNSIVGLVAVSLLYIYLMRGSNWLYSLVLVGFVVPIAIFANILRIMTLILLTYFCGNDVAQGFLHVTAGILLFSTALLCVFGLDHLIAYGRALVRRKA